MHTTLLSRWSENGMRGRTLTSFLLARNIACLDSHLSKRRNPESSSSLGLKTSEAGEAHELQRLPDVRFRG